MFRVLFVVCCYVALGLAFRNETETLRCGPNEIAKCVFWCPPEKTCRTRGIMIRCKEDPNPCVNKCVCADGFYRNSIGECISNEQCDQCSAPNEFYSCNSACDNVCADLHKQTRKNCPIHNIVCNKWCYCDDGYARDANRNCIPIDQCPPRTTLPESDPSGDAALERYRRSAGGDHSECKDPNEIFACATSCPPESCIASKALFKCDSDEVCENRCACKSGYYRLEDESPCIPKCECPQMV